MISCINPFKHFLPFRTVKATRAAPSTPIEITRRLQPSWRRAHGIGESRWPALPSGRQSAAKEAWQTWWTPWNRRSLWSWQRQNKTVRGSLLFLSCGHVPAGFNRNMTCVNVLSDLQANLLTLLERQLYSTHKYSFACVEQSCSFSLLHFKSCQKLTGYKGLSSEGAPSSLSRKFLKYDLSFTGLWPHQQNYIFLDVTFPSAQHWITSLVLVHQQRKKYIFLFPNIYGHDVCSPLLTRLKL